MVEEKCLSFLKYKVWNYVWKIDWKIVVSLRSIVWTLFDALEPYTIRSWDFRFQLQRDKSKYLLHWLPITLSTESKDITMACRPYLFWLPAVFPPPSFLFLEYTALATSSEQNLLFLLLTQMLTWLLFSLVWWGQEWSPCPLVFLSILPKIIASTTPHPPPLLSKYLVDKWVNGLMNG